MFDVGSAYSNLPVKVGVPACAFKFDIVSLQEFHEDQFELIASEKSTWTRMLSVTYNNINLALFSNEEQKIRMQSIGLRKKVAHQTSNFQMTQKQIGACHQPLR